MIGLILGSAHDRTLSKRYKVTPCVLPHFPLVFLGLIPKGSGPSAPRGRAPCGTETWRTDGRVGKTGPALAVLVQGTIYLVRNY